MNPIEQQFFNDLEKKLWPAADKLRSNLDAAVYKHVVLGVPITRTNCARERLFSDSPLGQPDQLVFAAFRILDSHSRAGGSKPDQSGSTRATLA